MDTGKASRTVEIMARDRVAEQRFSEDQRICNDPYAIRFVSEEAKKAFNRTPRLPDA